MQIAKKKKRKKRQMDEQMRLFVLSVCLSDLLLLYNYTVSVH